MSTPTPPTTAPTDTTVLGFSPKDILGTLAVVAGISVTELSSLTIGGDNYFKALIDNLPAKAAFLGVSAAAGAVIALGYSFYHNNWSIEVPKFNRDKIAGKISLQRWGFLDEMLFAAVFAIAAAYARIPTDVKHPPEQPKPAEVDTQPPQSNSGAAANPVAPKKESEQKPKQYPLTGSDISFIACAALAGARMRMASSDRGVLQQALALAVERGALPGGELRINNAKTALDAAAVVASAPEVSQLLQATLGTSNLDHINLKALTNFDLEVIRARAASLVRVDREGFGLTLGTLKNFKVLAGPLNDKLTKYRLSEVAQLSVDEFAKVFDPKADKATLEKIRIAAKAAMDEWKANFDKPKTNT